jgi:hypothetical protein
MTPLTTADLPPINCAEDSDGFCVKCLLNHLLRRVDILQATVVRVDGLHAEKLSQITAQITEIQQVITHYMRQC